MLIRNMTAEDISAVVEIEKECFSLPWSEKSFAESIAREDTIFLVCVLGGGGVFFFFGVLIIFHI